VANGKLEWTPLDDGQITMGKIWGVLGVLHERTKILPKLVTKDQCELHQSKCRETLAKTCRAKEEAKGGRRFSAGLVVLSSVLSAVLAVLGGIILLNMGG